MIWDVKGRLEVLKIICFNLQVEKNLITNKYKIFYLHPTKKCPILVRYNQATSIIVTLIKKQHIQKSCCYKSMLGLKF